jgi:hypothetical protein
LEKEEGLIQSGSLPVEKVNLEMALACWAGRLVRIALMPEAA